MKVWPVLLDSEPEYLGSPTTGVSLLFTPIGGTSLVARLCRDIEQITADMPTIVAPANARANYRTRMHDVCPGTTITTTLDELAGVFAGVETSDLLLFIDPRCFATDSAQLKELTEAGLANPRVARHLVAFAADVAGTKESVNVDGDGLVRSVHRYYKPATWPFIANVGASLVPVSSGILPLQAMPASLHDLRQQLVSRGVPSRDVAIREGAFDLNQEHGLLAAMEQTVLDAAAASRADGGSSTVLVGEGHLIHPSVRLLGPVVIQADVRIDPNVTIVGPTLVGTGSHVGAGALLAHAAVGAYAVVPAGQVLRDRVWFGDLDLKSSAPGDARVPSFSERLSRLSSDDDGELSDSDGKPAGIYPVIKRGIDIAVSAVALLVLSPLLLVIAVLVWLDSKGPVIFTHTREGVGGEQFNCLKFRTMRVGANDLQRKLKVKDQMDGPHFKMASDPRITRMGRWLRATNVDELPQLVNVLFGDMSLVGPRPSPFRENQICVPWRAGRLSVRPGITGMWQVCRQDRQLGDFHQWIEYDLLYVRHMSLLLDIKVIAATIFTLGGKYAVPVTWLVQPDEDADLVTYPTDRDAARTLAAERSVRSAR